MIIPSDWAVGLSVARWHSVCIKVSHVLRQVEHYAAKWQEGERLLRAELHARRAEDAVRQASHIREGPEFKAQIQVRLLCTLLHPIPLSPRYTAQLPQRAAILPCVTTQIQGSAAIKLRSWR